MFGRIITALVTPFDDQDNISFETLRRLVDHLIKTDSTAILVGGIFGESPTLSEVEKVLLFEKTLEYVHGRLPVLAGVGSNSTKDTIHFIKHINYLPLAGYCVISPGYNLPDQEGLKSHFQAIALSTNKPIILYNDPYRTGVDLSIETLSELAKCPNIIGIREASLHLEKIKQLVAQDLPKFKIYIGDDRNLLDGLIEHADGIISIASHIYGNTIHHIIQLVKANQLEDAKAIFAIYQPKFEALCKKANPVPIKAALNRLGFNIGGVRLPLVEMKSSLKNELFTILGI